MSNEKRCDHQAFDAVVLRDAAVPRDAAELIPRGQCEMATTLDVAQIYLIVQV